MSARPQPRLRLAATFWLLIAGWCCANLGPDTFAGLGHWLSGMAAPSHQQRLTLEVAKLLAGERAPVAVATSEPRLPKPLTTAPDTLFKKLEVPVPTAARCAPPGADATLAGRKPDDPWQGRARAAPPHRPPRQVA